MESSKGLKAAIMGIEYKKFIGFIEFIELNWKPDSVNGVRHTAQGSRLKA